MMARARGGGWDEQGGSGMNKASKARRVLEMFAASMLVVLDPACGADHAGVAERSSSAKFSSGKEGESGEKIEVYHDEFMMPLMSILLVPSLSSLSVEGREGEEKE